jgi:ABC-2 type transport system ATP-binding protein
MASHVIGLRGFRFGTKGAILPVGAAPVYLAAMTAIRVRELVKTFGALRAVDGVDIEVERGICFGLLGPNGAGKTTTIEILEGIQRATSGEVRVLDRAWETDAAGIRKRIGVQLQETKLYERASAEEILTTFRSFYDDPLPLDEVLEIVGLTDKRKAWYKTLSGGQKQRLAIACAVVARPDLVFLDEPTTGLDPAARRGVWEIVRGLRRRGATLLLTTHYMEEAEVLCDRLAIMNAGKVIALGTPRELIARLGGAEVIELSLAAADLAPIGEVLRALGGVASCERDGDVLRLAVGEVHAVLPAVLDALARHGAKLERLATRHATLDDVFLKLTGSTIQQAEQGAKA